MLDKNKTKQQQQQQQQKQQQQQQKQQQTKARALGSTQVLMLKAGIYVMLLVGAELPITCSSLHCFCFVL
jgi:Na+/glutamate symporter